MTELPNIMASLKLDDKQAQSVEAAEENSREGCSDKVGDVKSYFMSKKVRLLRIKTLATIYEEPKVNKNGVITHIGPSKLRKINFNIISKEKIKKRKAKIKKIVICKISKKGPLSMEEFLPRLHGLIGSSPNGTDRNVT